MINFFVFFTKIDKITPILGAVTRTWHVPAWPRTVLCVFEINSGKPLNFAVFSIYVFILEVGKWQLTTSQSENNVDDIHDRDSDLPDSSKRDSGLVDVEMIVSGTDSQSSIHKEAWVSGFPIRFRHCILHQLLECLNIEFLVAGNWWWYESFSYRQYSRTFFIISSSIFSSSGRSDATHNASWSISVRCHTTRYLYGKVRHTAIKRAKKLMPGYICRDYIKIKQRLFLTNCNSIAVY